MSTHNLCFRAKIRKNVYPSKPQFYYIKVGCKGVLITRTCYPDAELFFLQSNSRNFVVSVRRYLFLWVLMKGYVISLWLSMVLPYSFIES